MLVSKHTVLSADLHRPT